MLCTSATLWRQTWKKNLVKSIWWPLLDSSGYVRHSPNTNFDQLDSKVGEAAKQTGYTKMNSESKMGMLSRGPCPWDLQTPLENGFAHPREVEFAQHVYLSSVDRKKNVYMTAMHVVVTVGILGTRLVTSSHSVPLPKWELSQYSVDKFKVCPSSLISFLMFIDRILSWGECLAFGP